MINGYLSMAAVVIVKTSSKLILTCFQKNTTLRNARLTRKDGGHIEGKIKYNPGLTFKFSDMCVCLCLFIFLRVCLPFCV